MKHLHDTYLRELAALCGGVALLVGVAVFLSGHGGGSVLSRANITPNSQAGCVVDCGGGGYPLVSISASPTTVSSGGYTTISFTAYNTATDNSTTNCTDINGQFRAGGTNNSGTWTNVGPITQPTTYTVSCWPSRDGWETSSANITVSTAATAAQQSGNTSACPTLAWQPWNNGVFVVSASQTRQISADGFNFCVTNSSSNQIVVHGGGSDASGQLQTFRSNASNMGASTF